MTVFTITQGDDSNALGQEINILIESDEDLTGYTAVFQLGEYQQKWDDITSKKLGVVIPRQYTKKLKTGPNYGGLKIYDSNGLAKTVIRDIKFFVLAEVVKDV